MSHRFVTGVLALAFLAHGAAQEALPNEEKPVDARSGLVIDADWELVRANCSGCHSTALLTQNRMSAEGWLRTIRWMQEKHNLWDLGDSEDRIVAYLEKHYGVEALPARRQPLNQPPLHKASTPWWNPDHSWSGQAANLYMDARPITAAVRTTWEPPSPSTETCMRHKTRGSSSRPIRNSINTTPNRDPAAAQTAPG